MSEAKLVHTSVEVRVRYSECDPQGLAHHSVFPVWLEIARTELLRQQGVAYSDMEADGIFFVVARMSFRFHKPAAYDDVLQVRATVRQSAGVKIDHEYVITRDGAKLATAETTLVCLDGAGKLRAVPEHLLP
jgi:acyl-CoA thioester hydrolase